MATKSKSKRASHDRSALIQWVGLGLAAALALLAAFILFDGDGADHNGAPAVVEITT